MTQPKKISLVLADVDGTLVTEQKVLTERAQAAVRDLRHAGIRFAITSGRPPLGMAMLFDALQLDTPIAGFNGGLFVERDLTILEQKTIPLGVTRQAIKLLREHGLDVWVYRGNDWLITKRDAPHVTVQRRQLIFVDPLRVVEQPADEGRLAVVHRACGGEAQQGGGAGVGGRIGGGGRRHQK